MRRRFFVLTGIIGPILLLSMCAIVVLLGLAGWWYFEQGDSSRIVRIMSLAPLKTPAASLPSEPQSDAPVEPQSGETGLESGADAATTDPDQSAGTTSNVEDDSELSLPPGTVNSISQEGVAQRLVIPKLGLDAPVVLAPIENRTWQVEHLVQTVGHLEGTAPPGSNSNAVFAAHVTLSTGVYGPFAGLGHLVAGDIIYVYDGGEEFQYVVDRFQTVDRAAVEVTYPSSSGQITLITCSNWDDVEGQYVERLIVTGRLAAG